MTTIKMEQSDHAWLDKALAGMNFFENLTMAHLETLLSAVSLVGYEKGEVVFETGTPGHAVFVVYEGSVRVRISSALIFNKTVATLGPGVLFGEMALLRDEPRSATVEAAEESKVFVIMADAFRKIAETNPDLKQTLEKLLITRMG